MVLCLTIISLFLPLIFAIYLIVKKLMLSEVSKKVLNSGFLGVSIINFLILTLSFIEKISFEFKFNVFNYENINFDIGILFNSFSNLYLIYATGIFILISIFAILFFKQKKQFMLTKQRFYIFLSLLNFVCYFTILSPNIFQTLLCWIISSFIILIFSYFDIFKLGADYNLNRYFRIFLTGDFLLLCAGLILFKYAIISNGYIQDTSVSYKDFGLLLSYIIGICPKAEIILLFPCLILGLFTRFFIIPFNTLFSFLANSSNLLYFSLISVVGPIFGLDLFIKLEACFDVISSYDVCFSIVLSIVSLFSLLLILFEKNFRIIFGYLFSALNSFLFASYLYFGDFRVIYCYMALYLFLLLIVAVILHKNKVGFKKRLINIQKGFIIERTHILLFEKIPYVISGILNFVDEKIFQFLIKSFIGIFKIINYYLVFKINRNNALKSLKSIIVIIAMFAVIAVVIVFFYGINGVGL